MVVKVSYEEFSRWISVIKDYYDWNESEYQRQMEKSEALKVVIEEMELTEVHNG